MWPIEAQTLLNSHFPCDTGALIDIFFSDQLFVLPKQRSKEVHNSIFGPQVFVFRGCHVETTRDAVLASDRALQIAKEKSIADDNNMVRNVLQSYVTVHGKLPLLIGERDTESDWRSS